MKKINWFGSFGLFGLLFIMGCSGMVIPEQFCVKHNGIEAEIINGTIKMPPAMYEINKGACPVECPVGFNCVDLNDIPDEAVIQEAHIRVAQQNDAHYICIRVPTEGFVATHVTKEICDEVGGQWVQEGSPEEKEYFAEIGLHEMPAIGGKEQWQS